METEAPTQLDLLKALGDNTRYAIYLELARSPVPLATAEVAETLTLHVNTVRPHLERMREVGLLEVSADHRGAPGRPQHRYSVATGAPSLGLEPAPYPTLARMLLRAAQAAGAGPDEVTEAGWEQGIAEAEQVPGAVPCVAALETLLARLGYDPETVHDAAGATIAFTHCPFRELAEANPDLVCGLHRGLVEGFVAARGDAEVTAFGTIADRQPCRVALITR